MKIKRKFKNSNAAKTLLSSKTDFVSFFGIADLYGIDRYLKCESLEDTTNLQDKAFCQMRAQMNRHRHAVYFECPEAPALYVDMIDALLEDEKYEDALSIVKSCPLRIPHDCKNSWSLIPNPKLDPYYDKEEDDIENAEATAGVLNN